MARDKAAAPPQHKRGRSRTGTGGTPAGKRSGAGPGHRRADPAGQGHGRREQERREIAGLEVRWVAVRLISAVVLDRKLPSGRPTFE